MEDNAMLLEAIPLFARELIAGGVAGGVAKTAVAPLERLKILFQTRCEFYNTGVLASFTRVAKTEGLLGFYRGNGASLARIIPYAALHFMAYEQYRRQISYNFPSMGNNTLLDLVAGSLSGGTALLVTYPLDVVRTKLAYQVVDPPELNVKGAKVSEHAFRGIRDCFTRTYKETGMRGLYRGVVPSLFGILPYAGLKFYFFEEMKRQVPDDYKRLMLVKLACGAFAGILGQTFTYPLDVVRRKMQVQQLRALNSSEFKGTFGTLFVIVKNEGWKHLFSGMTINYLKVVPSVAIGFTVYDSMKAYLSIPPREKAIVEEAINHRQM
ncbi:hypothetical protein R6Q59_013342 [Mikania micrantha]|uniref:Uncharacterized protein n=1 Tax=Mikania micrantha TaxID=192012 RepID=A0A5N6LR02_9ASTR|nr:hypothetical protein E3N88_40795 [Mikania micrantha]